MTPRDLRGAKKEEKIQHQKLEKKHLQDGFTLRLRASAVKTKKKKCTVLKHP
jgi:hypothetical protein